MTKKETNRITMADVVRIVTENYATKRDLSKTREQVFDHIDKRHNELAALIKKIPTRDEFDMQANIQKRLTRIEKHLNLA